MQSLRNYKSSFDEARSVLKTAPKHAQKVWKQKFPTVGALYEYELGRARELKNDIFHVVRLEAELEWIASGRPFFDLDSTGDALVFSECKNDFDLSDATIPTHVIEVRTKETALLVANFVKYFLIVRDDKNGTHCELALAKSKSLFESLGSEFQKVSSDSPFVVDHIVKPSERTTAIIHALSPFILKNRMNVPTGFRGEIKW